MNTSLRVAVGGPVVDGCEIQGLGTTSVVTVRETPVAKTTSASAGGFAVVAENIDVDTAGRIELVDLTDTVMAFVRRSGVQEGLLSLWSMHTSMFLSAQFSWFASRVGMMKPPGVGCSTACAGAVASSAENAAAAARTKCLNDSREADHMCRNLVT